MKAGFKKTFRRASAAVLTAALIAASAPIGSAIAAPKQMPDGTVFDAEFYAATYPDVVAALGNSEAAMWKHYQEFGRSEGRRATAGSAQTQAAPQINRSTAAPVTAPASFVKRFKGRNVSICGDSISTFGGNHPQGYVAHYPQNYMPTSDLTWWMQTIRAGGMNFVANASWSGARVSGNSQDETGKTGCSTKRAQGLFGKDVAPNLIFVMMGTNDFLGSVPLGNSGSVEAAQSSGNGTFAGAYNTMLANLQAAHPGAQIVCLTCTPVICVSTDTKQQNSAGQTIDDYNAVIRSVAAARGLAVCDVNACGINQTNWKQYLGDGIHPTAQGMALIADYIVNHL